MGFRVTITNPGPKFKEQMAGYAARLTKTVEATMRMIQSMLKSEADRDISGAGNFGERWTDGLHVNLEGSMGNMRLYMTHDIDYASIFETGGTIHGNPMLWIPLSGTDAANVRASAFPGGVRGGRTPPKTGRPLLFSVTDRKPKYFGIESVQIDRKFNLTENVNSVMSNFRQVFSDEWAASK